MSHTIVLLLFVVIFLVILLGGMWIPLGIGVGGLVLLALNGDTAAYQSLGFVTWGSLNSFILTAIPLYLLMGELILQAGLSRNFYRALSQWLDRIPGGLLHSNILGSAAFAAVTGSSLTTAMTMGTVSWPETERQGYSRERALGSLAAGGTLGILIPPSIAMILYGVFTETSVARLFLAGIVPGLVLVGLFMLLVTAMAIIRPDGRSRLGASWRSRLTSLPSLIPLILLIGAVLGSIYAGVATPTEAAALGGVGALLIAGATMHLSWSVIRVALANTMRNTAMIMMIVLGGYIFAFAIERVGIASDIATWVGGLGLSTGIFIFFVSVLYLLLGAIMDSIAIIVSTIPVMFPVAMSAGIDPIWFGIYMVVLIELGQITPPMGIVCFALQGVTKQPLDRVFKGVMPYFFVFAVFLIILNLVPSLATWLPSHM